MSSNGAVRGGRGASSGGGSGGRGGSEAKKREAILDLSKYVNQRLKVEFVGGRLVVGTLKGYDQLLNLVMDDIEEQETPHSAKRSLGLGVFRGTSLVLFSPLDGSQQIQNPFLVQE